MTVHYFPFDAGVTLTAFPVSLHGDFGDYLDHCITATDGTGDDAGRYAFEIPDGLDDFFAVFVGVPDSFVRSIGMLVTRPLDRGIETVYFTQEVSGLSLRALPSDSSLSMFPSDSVPCVEVAGGLYSVTVQRTATNTRWFLFDGSETPKWNSFLGVVDLVSYGVVAPPVGPGTAGVVRNLLSVDYEDDWQYLDGIETCGFEFGPNRTTMFVAPSTGVKAKRGSPNQTDIVGAASEFGFDSHDCIFVIWSQTLLCLSTAKVINIRNGDIIKDSFGVRWVIKTHKRTQDFAQWRCYCKRSTLEEVDYDANP